MSVGETVGARDLSLQQSDSRRGSQLENMRRRMTHSSLGDEEGAGLGDPFAEIFAMIATAEAPAPTPDVQSVEPSVDEESDDTGDTAVREETDSDNNAEASAEIAPVNSPEALLNTGDEPAEVVEAEATEVEATLEAESDDSRDQTGQETVAEVIDTSTTSTSEENDDTPVLDVEPSQENVVEQEVATLTPQTNRRDRGEQESEIVASKQTQTEASETKIDATSAPNKKDVDSQGDRQESKDRSAPVAPEANDRVQRRRYSGGENSQNQQEESPSQGSSTSGSTLGENPSVGRRGQEGRSSLAGPSGGGIDISSMNPVSPSASIGAPIGALNNASPSANSKISAPQSSAASSVSSSANASAKGSDVGPPIDPSSNQQQPASNSSSKSGVTGTDTLSAVQRAKMVQRVSRGFQQLGPNGGQIRMRLSPDELGSVQLQLKLQNGELSGTMLTQTEAASQALREQLPQLRSSLENQGIRLDRMEIQTEAAANSQDAEASGGRFGDTSGHSGRGFEQQQHLADQRQRTSWSDVRATPKGLPSDPPENGGGPVNHTPVGAVDLRA